MNILYSLFNNSTPMFDINFIYQVINFNQKYKYVRDAALFENRREKYNFSLLLYYNFDFKALHLNLNEQSRINKYYKVFNFKELIYLVNYFLSANVDVYYPSIKGILDFIKTKESLEDNFDIPCCFYYDKWRHSFIFTELKVLTESEKFGETYEEISLDSYKNSYLFESEFTRENFLKYKQLIAPINNTDMQKLGIITYVNRRGEIQEVILISEKELMDFHSSILKFVKEDELLELKVLREKFIEYFSKLNPKHINNLFNIFYSINSDSDYFKYTLSTNLTVIETFAEHFYKDKNGLLKEIYSECVDKSVNEKNAQENI